MGNKELLEQLGIDTKNISSDGKVTCPKCSNERKNKTDRCLSVSVAQGVYNCHHCGFSGKVNNAVPFEPKQKDYIRPKFVNTTALSTEGVNEFFKRSISQKTLNDCKVTQSLSWMPQTQSEIQAINFNYFRDGELINIKYRGLTEKHFKLEKNAELIFYGLDDIKNSDWCIIVEGECDKLAWWEVGVKECVSVPNGASKSSNANLEYLDNCVSYFENKTKIILATDDDEAGHALREELSRRLGKERCFKVDFKGYKDTNELLVATNATSVKQLILEPNLIPYPIEGIITADMMWDDMEDLFQNGLQKGAVTKELKELDEFLSFVTGQLMVLTGIPNHGKSPFALMIMACLSLHHGWRWGLFSPEHKPLKIFMAKGTGFSQREKDLAKAFISEHFYFIEPEDEDYGLDNILDKAKKLVAQKGIKGFLIDPWNKLEHHIEKGESETNYISKALDKVIKFDQRNSVFSIIVAHPTKIRKVFKAQHFEVPNLYDISGSSNWFNKPDIGVTFYRNFDTQKSEVYIQKMKYEHLGKQGKVELRYSLFNGRFNNLYGDFDNTNWLLPNEPQTELSLEQKMQESVPVEYDDIDF